MTGTTPRKPAPRRRPAKAPEPMAAKAPRRAKTAAPKAVARRKAAPRATPPAGGNPIWREVADYLAGVAMLGAAAWGLMAFLDVI
ncbi:hypothetical protein CR162_04050 [Pseudoroseomonas rhizosphaerae]|uniref:Uncharacterized protein n=1 Tax=Teichococcus rhizosphaerae TaxID=1335062 RepID=A0A2C7AH26_9PROT|nr:hypothetical protein [Pseudoroseomonas rhizosphaerae]PHK96506.1 hypothetical protein CR162_04050 [Pseudoroseomonas rhizosphaerae]